MRYCTGCGRPADRCDGSCRRPLDPPRHCGECGRKLAVQVTPGGYRAACREHGPVGPGAYQVAARNIAADSNNKIHDDTVARRYGFAGGLVPGVVVHAYLTHLPAERWGLDWLTAGGLHSRFVKPVYDGDVVFVDADGDTLTARTATADPAATATVRAPSPQGGEVLDPARWLHLPLPHAEDRPPASAEAFAAHPVLGALDVTFRADLGAQYLGAIGETLPLYAELGIAHPGWLIAQANHVLAANVTLGPWIHVESDVQHLGLIRDGDAVSTRAVVLGTSERKGHRFVELDVLIVDGAERPVLRARHVAIYQPRLAG